MEKNGRQMAHSLRQAVVEVTNRCNLRCPHCASASGRARTDEMSLGELRQVMRDLAALGCRTVTLLGGEFLLRPDWYEVAASVKAVDMELQLITNGLLVTEAVRAQFKALAPRAVGVSLDGATPESYRRTRGVDGYATCRRLLDDLVADGHRQVTAITTFTSRNLGDFDLFAETFKDTPILWQIQVAHRAGERFDDSLLLSPDQFAWYAERVTHCLYDLNGRLKLLLIVATGAVVLLKPYLRLPVVWKTVAAVGPAEGKVPVETLLSTSPVPASGNVGSSPSSVVSCSSNVAHSTHVAPASSNTAPAPRHVVAVSRGTAPTETTGTKVESVPTPSLPKPHLAQPLVQNVSLFQPQKGSPEQILSRLDRVLGERPKYLKISLSACAKRNDWSIERYEHQVLVPVVERLRGAGVGFSLVPGSGKYGAVVLDVAKRFGCDLN